MADECKCGRSGFAPGVCVDIDGEFWPGHGYPEAPFVGGEPPETAWLIERGQPEGQVPPVWLVKQRWSAMTGYTWTADAFAATRFASKAEADAYIAENSGVLPRQAFVGRAVEHGFAAAPVVTSEAGLRVLRFLDEWQRRHTRPGEDLIYGLDGRRHPGPRRLNRRGHG